MPADGDEVNILITGGGGYLGYHIALALAVESIMQKSKSDIPCNILSLKWKNIHFHIYIFIHSALKAMSQFILLLVDPNSFTHLFAFCLVSDLRYGKIVLYDLRSPLKVWTQAFLRKSQIEGLESEINKRIVFHQGDVGDLDKIR